MSYDTHRHAHAQTYERAVTQHFILLPPFLQDLFRAGIGAVLYIITSLICVIGGAGDGARIAGGVSKTTLTQPELSTEF